MPHTPTTLASIFSVFSLNFFGPGARKDGVHVLSPLPPNDTYTPNMESIIVVILDKI